MNPPQSQVYERQRVHAPKSLRTPQANSNESLPDTPNETVTPPIGLLPDAGLSPLLERFVTAKPNFDCVDPKRHLDIRKGELSHSKSKTSRQAHGDRSGSEGHLWGEIITDPTILRGKKLRRDEAETFSGASSRLNSSHLQQLPKGICCDDVRYQDHGKDKKESTPPNTDSGITQHKPASRRFPKGLLKPARKTTSVKPLKQISKTMFNQTAPLDSSPSALRVASPAPLPTTTEARELESSPIFRQFNFNNFTTDKSQISSSTSKRKPDRRIVRISKISGPISITESSQPMIVAPSATPPELGGIVDKVNLRSIPSHFNPDSSVPTNALRHLKILPDDPLFQSSTNGTSRPTNENQIEPPIQGRKTSKPLTSGTTVRAQRSRSRSRERRRSSNGSEFRVNHRCNLIYSRPVRRRSTSSAHSQRRKLALSDTRRKKPLKPKSRARSEPFLPHYDEIPLGRVPPYCERLNKAVDLILFDPRYAYPVLRFNRKLINTTGELLVTITKLLDMRLLPGDVDIHEIRRVDDRKFNKLLPELLIDASRHRHRRRRRHRRPREERNGTSLEADFPSHTTRTPRTHRNR